MIQSCISCYAVLDGHVSVTNRRPPRPGDYSICNYCGTIYQLGEQMEMLKLDDDAIGQLAVDNPKLYQALQVITAAISKQIKEN